MQTLLLLCNGPRLVAPMYVQFSKLNRLGLVKICIHKLSDNNTTLSGIGVAEAAAC